VRVSLAGLSLLGGLEGGWLVGWLANVRSLQVVDYRAVGFLPAYLAATYGDRPFDVILDCVGTQALYGQSAGYLKAEGVYINVGAFEGVAWTLWCWAKNLLWPTFLGGTPRKYVMFSTMPSTEKAEKLAQMVDAGKLRVVVDSVFPMDDVLAVRDCLHMLLCDGEVSRQTLIPQTGLRSLDQQASSR
jgi:NADPH:quinone reductase-like Zn-dependent oxidoreductase